mmetsp:Transcript_52233/g.94077  ORF Transcript_52233/g.94077 Transcript_52233/m.94077 type:complete len:592 (-) Transcript_52233:16-1791(-)
MHFHGAYFSNYGAWLKDPKSVAPSSHILWSLVGQDILNSYTSQYFSGITSTSGFYQLWRSEGIVTQSQLKYACGACLIATLISLSGAYLHMQLIVDSIRFKPHQGHLLIMFGFGSISECAHQIHISLPVNSLLDAASTHLHTHVKYQASKVHIVNLLATTGKLLNPSTGSIFLAQIAAHHLAVGVVFIVLGLIRQFRSRFTSLTSYVDYHAQLSISLGSWASLSMITAVALTASPVYPYLSGTDYPTLLCLFVHHSAIAGFLLTGAGAHASIFTLRTSPKIVQIRHRDPIIGHLIWVCIALGLHSFGLQIHNDTLEALGRPEDTFCDNSIQLKPSFASEIQSILSLELQPGIEVLDGKIVRMSQELGTADFIVHHVHAFTIHVTLLILLKGILYARNSRLVSDKLELGFAYPCDGPGRGGTCQISPWDHLFLAVFWMYNSLSVIIFHYFWKMQSDVWGEYVSKAAQHYSQGDFSANSITINGWLRKFLWSEASQVIQSYALPSICSYGFIFLAAHFVWAFSLMFLFSGRAYWQELIESILWSHHKLKVVPHIQARALSISQGRAVGLTHYILGGIGCTWAFIISRILVLNY